LSPTIGLPVNRCLVIAALATALVAAPPATAAGWKQVTASNGSNIDQVGLLRTADGVLHVAWHHRTGPNTEDLLHTAIAPNGAVGATVPIASGWTGFENPALVAVPGGIRAFFGAIRSIDPNETNNDLNTALSGDGGASWALQTGSIVPVGGQAYGSPVAATTLPDGTPLQAWAGTLGTWVHAGLSPATPSHDYQAPLGHYGYDTGLASDAAGQTVMAWYSNATGHLGVFAQGVAADGSPVGAPANMSSTSNMAVGMIGRTPIVARRGGGIYVAYATGYPTINRVRLWRVGTSSARLIAAASANNTATATLAAAPDGRLWVAWKDTIGGKPHVYVRRSNKAATAFGAVVDAGQPKGGASGYRLDASATATALDVFGLFAIGTGSTTATYYRRVLPGLTLTALPSQLRRGAAKEVSFTVVDAGDPVAHAKVRAGGASGTTNTKGKVALRIPARTRSLLATASASGYAPGELRLRVRR
jgi:hypothetical protein